jgi:hypothetical protein
MSLCVAVFTIGIISGPGAWPLMLLECGAGLFLGLVMQRRMGHFWIVILGTTAGALASYMLLIIGDLLTGIPITDLVKSLQNTFAQFIALMGVLAGSIGLGHWWQLHLLPPVNAFAQFTFKYWLVGFYIISWIFLLPVVIVVYYVTNLFTRLLGYKVRPFAGNIFEGLVYRIMRVFLRYIPRRSKIGQHWFIQNVRREVRRLGIARQKAK